jgi:amino acid adenylation domain-containing protein
VLFFMPHHAIWDGWSFDVFLNELDRLYAAFKRGEPSPLPPLPVNYGDYCAWQQQWLEGPELEKQTAFWLQQMSGELPVLDLPIDAPRPASMTFAGATEAFQLSSELVGKLSEIGRRSGATLYMVLLAAFDVLLFRLSGQTDLIVGTPIRGRSLPELEPLIGYFVNALPLRMRLDPNSTFGELVAGVRRTCLEAFEHQEMPFEVLVQKLKIDRDTSRTPLYSAFFTFQDVRNRKSSVGDLSYEQIHVHPPVSPTELSLWVKQVDSGIVGGLDFATDIFQRETAARWLAEYQVLLESIVALPESAIARLPLLTSEETRALAAISATERDYPREARLHELIERQVDAQPDAVAVTCGDRSLSYRELDAASNRLAHALAAAGVRAGARVGICLERSLELLIAALATLKSGAAYVPLDPMFPEERLRFMADDAAISAVIIHAGTRELCPRVAGATVLDLDLERDRILALESTRLPASPGAASEAAAYVIYTSGSTGKPKGVMIPHAGVVNFVTSMVREPGVRPADRLLAVTTLSFDIAVLELYAPLSVGAQVVIATHEMIADGDLLDEAIAEHDISVMQATPSTWRLLLGSGFRPPAGFKILCGGEAFPRDLAERLVETGAEVWNMYGPTETTVWSTCCKLERPLGDISIGLPIANTSVHIVDERGELCPLGSAGELWIGGDGVALGYHQRPELTAERFVKNPFRSGRAYRTGDIVRLRRGSLEYLRRNDNQVKVRGYRIELGDIEAALVAIPDVRQAVLTVREVRPGDHRLIAYLSFSGSSALPESELRARLRTRLPEYMIPQHFVALAEFPQTPNGKVDRRALPDPLGASEQTHEGYVAPSTDNEKMLAALWQEILGIPKVGARDNFFELGGHSLLCLQMTAKLEQQTGTRLNPRVILRNDLSQVAAALPSAAASVPAAKTSGEGPARSFSERLFDKLSRRRSGA